MLKAKPNVFQLAKMNQEVAAYFQEARCSSEGAAQDFFKYRKSI